MLDYINYVLILRIRLKEKYHRDADYFSVLLDLSTHIIIKATKDAKA